jgi:hypothetical protein
MCMLIVLIITNGEQKLECTGKVETDVLPSRSVAKIATGKVNRSSLLGVHVLPPNSSLNLQVNDESGPDSSLPRQGINETDLPR